MKASDTDFCTISQAAEQLGVSRQRMHQIIGEMNAKTLQVSPKLHLISKEELTKIEKKRKSQKR